VRASTTYHLPAEIAEHIDLVGELLQFPRLRLKSLTRLTAGGGSWPNACTGQAGLFQCKGPPMCRGQSEAWCNTQGAKAAGCAWSGGSASRCAGLVTPAVLAQRYKLPGNSSKNAAGNSMAVAEFQGQYYKDTDLATFSSGCYQNVKVDKTIGGDQQTAGIEAELDIEYIKSVAPQVPLTVVYDAKYSLLGWANQINSMADAPLIHSVSYGNDEIQQTSVAYMSTVNTAFLKAGAKGLSILFASGDQGVCGRSGCAGKSGSGLHAFQRQESELDLVRKYAGILSMYQQAQLADLATHGCCLAIHPLNLKQTSLRLEADDLAFLPQSSSPLFQSQSSSCHRQHATIRLYSTSNPLLRRSNIVLAVFEVFYHQPMIFVPANRLKGDAPF